MRRIWLAIADKKGPDVSKITGGSKKVVFLSVKLTSRELRARRHGGQGESEAQVHPNLNVHFLTLFIFRKCGGGRDLIWICANRI